MSRMPTPEMLLLAHAEDDLRNARLAVERATVRLAECPDNSTKQQMWETKDALLGVAARLEDATARVVSLYLEAHDLQSKARWMGEKA